jgi:hypothetical protein
VIRWMSIRGTAIVNRDRRCVLSSPCDFHDFCTGMQTENVPDFIGYKMDKLYFLFVVL